MNRIRQIRGTMTLSNGETVEFMLGPEEDGRWGNTRENLADAVIPCEVIDQAMIDNDLWAYGEDDN